MRIYNVSQRRLHKTRPFANTAVVTVQMVCQSLVRIPGFHLATSDCAFSFVALEVSQGIGSNSV